MNVKGKETNKETSCFYYYYYCILLITNKIGIWDALLSGSVECRCSNAGVILANDNVVDISAV